MSYHSLPLGPLPALQTQPPYPCSLIIAPSLLALLFLKWASAFPSQDLRVCPSFCLEGSFSELHETHCFISSGVSSGALLHTSIMFVSPRTKASGCGLLITTSPAPVTCTWYLGHNECSSDIW